MWTQRLELAVREPQAADMAASVLVVIKNSQDRQTVVAQLEAAECRVVTAASYGLAELLASQAASFDLLVTSQSAGEMGCLGLLELARSVEPDLPIVVLDEDAVRGHGVITVVHAAIRRWPMRDRPLTSVH